MEQISFNSNLVRLIGAIASAIAALGTFQFQFGSINSALLLLNDTPPSSFNSNLVRLIVAIIFDDKRKVSSFQFQFGSINSGG